jgi:hypothetical protein
MGHIIEDLAKGYFVVYERQKREYFGLRDFYSLVKMVYATVCLNSKEPSKEDVVYAVQRNFGGYFGDFDPTAVFLTAIYPGLDQRQFTVAKDLVPNSWISCLG